ncbi:TfoX/Sxy family protein [Lactiplantibacillus plantarum]|nr:TfoX/Sxy family protein [Lactiplantibacillus plantarum]
MALLTTLPNIGPTLAKQLQAVAITTPEQLKSTGSKVAFTKRPTPTLVFNYCIRYKAQLRIALTHSYHRQLAKI